MKTSVAPTLAAVLGATLVIGGLFTVPAAARSGGGFPSQIGPSYPFPSYCEQCFGSWQAQPVPPAPRPAVHHHKEHQRIGANAPAATPK